MPMNPPDGKLPGRVLLRDTTLREGIQIPGTRIASEQHQQWIERLEAAGVDQIEVGLPDGVTACAGLARFIRERGLRIQATALVPCYTERWASQIELAVESGIHRIDVLAPVSDFLLGTRGHYGMEPGEITERIEQVVRQARRTPLVVGVGLIDASRAPEDRLHAIVSRLKPMGVEWLLVYDSVGILRPTQTKPFIAAMGEASGLPIHFHGHNDYGMATANTLAAVEGGATNLDVAVNGLGGRAGNAALEEVALALHNLYGVRTGLDLGQLKELSGFARRMTGLETWPLKPVVGDFCFSHVPVMHIRCIAGGDPPAFEPYPPEQVGAERKYDFSLPVDYTAALEPFVLRSGCRPSPEQLDTIVAQLKARRDRSGWTEAAVIEVVRSVCEQSEVVR